MSLEDNLFRIFGGDRIQNLMKTFGVADLPIESKMLTNSLSEAQRKVGLMKGLFEMDSMFTALLHSLKGADELKDSPKCAPPTPYQRHTTRCACSSPCLKRISCSLHWLTA